MTCEQCGMAIGERWYRIRLKDNAIVHVLCLTMLWAHGTPTSVRKATTAERMKELRKWSPVQMPTGRLPMSNKGL